MSGPGLISTSVAHNNRRKNSQRPTDFDGRRGFEAATNGHAETEREFAIWHRLGSNRSSCGFAEQATSKTVDEISNRDGVKQNNSRQNSH